MPSEKPKPETFVDLAARFPPLSNERLLHVIRTNHMLLQVDYVGTGGEDALAMAIELLHLRQKPVTPRPGPVDGAGQDAPERPSPVERGER